MKPTVINNNNNNNNNNSSNSNSNNNSKNNCDSERQREPQLQQQPSSNQQQSHQQQQPYFNYPLGSHPIGMTDFGFGASPGFNFNGPDDDDDDMFYSRSRFMRDPWDGLGWTANRKRRGSLQDEAQPSQTTQQQTPPTFETTGGRAGTRVGADIGDIFGGRSNDIFSRYQPNWNMTWHPRMKRAQAPSPQPQPQATPQGNIHSQQHGVHPMSTDDDDYVGTIFDHIPAEFRRYFSRDFGFPSMRDHYKPAAHSSTDHVVPPTENNLPPRQAPPQTHFHQPQDTQPKYRDAAMQTDHNDAPPLPQSPTGNMQPPNLNQHGLRNTMDMGQRSPNENPRTHRAHSAPPESAEEDQQQQPRQTFTYTTAQTHPIGGGNAFATATAFATSGQPNKPPQSSRSTSTSTSTTYQPPQSETQATPMPPPPAPQPSSGPQSPSMRTIPIRIESRKRADPKKQQPQPTSPEQADAQIDGPEQSAQPQPETTMPVRPPHSNESIHKIQNIQRDVLDLMYKVEKFAGLKNDKEYLYLDEMLTRNLIRLDDIDTQGNESIRLARKEAIKCIQASLTVLEAKAEENKSEARNSKVDLNIESNQSEETAGGDANNNNQENTTKELEATDGASSSNDIEMEKTTIDSGTTINNKTNANDTNMETGDVETATD